MDIDTLQDSILDNFYYFLLSKDLHVCEHEGCLKIYTETVSGNFMIWHMQFKDGELCFGKTRIVSGANGIPTHHNMILKMYDYEKNKRVIELANPNCFEDFYEQFSHWIPFNGDD